MGNDPMAPRADDPFDGESPPGMITVDVSSDGRFQIDETVSRTLTQRDFVFRRPVRFMLAELVASPS